ncbi:MAG: hypothetical protein LBK97_04185 [Prevotellaceae bacterium]|nr:hypothetical protein [Prevotellaceae bacterium]
MCDEDGWETTVFPPFLKTGKPPAFLYSYKINGIKAQFYDPYANTPVFYLLLNKNPQ